MMKKIIFFVAALGLCAVQMQPLWAAPYGDDQGLDENGQGQNQNGQGQNQNGQGQNQNGQGPNGQ